MSAAIPASVVERASRGSTEARRTMSHGRGGAGNIGTTPSDFDAPSLDTPTLKGEMYTTGRGGSGNMAKNVDPEATRRAQDVVGHPRRESNSSTHVGRGGAANIFHPSTLAAVAQSDVHDESAIDSSSDGPNSTVHHRNASKGLADRGKEWLRGKK